MATMKPEKIIIVGGGPAGLAAAIYNARADLKPLVIAGSPPGGQLTLTNEVENYPGFERILGSELIAKMKKQAEKFGARFIDQNVVKVDFSQKPFTLYTSNQKTDQSYRSLAVLIATGARAAWLGLQSEQRFRGKGVSACATCDGFFFRNQVVAVVGGGDSALEEALTLTKFAKKVYIIHRRDSFRASKIMQKRVFNNSKIKIIYNAVVQEIIGENKVEEVKLKVKNEKLKVKVKNLKLEGVFVAIGHKPATDFLKGSKVLFDEKGYIITSEGKALNMAKWLHGYTATNSNLTMKRFNNLAIKKFNFFYQYMTSIPGVFAAGDVIDPVYRQAATAVGMGVAAALEIEHYLTT